MAYPYPEEQRVPPVQTGSVMVGGSALVLVAGPCVIESKDLCLSIGAGLRDVCAQLGVGYIFKASFDKANRTSLDSFRGPGLEEGLRILESISSELGVPVLSDVHDVSQVAPAADVLDVIQIPAFLCRQTDLLLAAGASGRAVNIKKGQFVAPQDMRHAVDKVRSTGNTRILLTERGTAFGYNALVSDMRSISIMRGLGCPVVYDATHSVQLPSAAGGKSGGDRNHALALGKAAVAAGADAVFAEVHPDPDKALCDAASMIPLEWMPRLLRELTAVFNVRRQ